MNLRPPAENHPTSNRLVTFAVTCHFLAKYLVKFTRFFNRVLFLMLFFWPQVGGGGAVEL